MTSSVFLAQEKQTDAQPANTAKPAFVMDVVSKVGLPNVIRIKSAPDIKIKTKKVPISILAVFRMITINSVINYTSGNKIILFITSGTMIGSHKIINLLHHA